MRAAFCKLGVTDERNRGVFVVVDVKIVAEGDIGEDLRLVLGRAFEIGVGPPALEDMGRLLVNKPELRRAHDLAPLLGRLDRRGDGLAACNGLVRPNARHQPRVLAQPSLAPQAQRNTYWSSLAKPGHPRPAREHATAE